MYAFTFGHGNLSSVWKTPVLLYQQYVSFLDIYLLEVSFSSIPLYFDYKSLNSSVYYLYLFVAAQEDYTTLTEHQVAKILNDVTADIFYSLKEKIAGVIEEI